jgi:hypothetical protein
MAISRASIEQLYQLFRNTVNEEAMPTFMAALGYAPDRQLAFFDDHPSCISTFFFANLAWDLRIPKDKQAAFVQQFIDGFKAKRAEGFFVTDALTISKRVEVPLDTFNEYLFVMTGYEQHYPKIWHIQRENRGLLMNRILSSTRSGRRLYRPPTYY